MISYVTGNLLTAEVEALVNTVNTVGVMGKGIALQFKETFPENFAAYAQAVKSGEVTTGKMFVSQVQRLSGSQTIINFPTKEKWFAPSRYEWVEEGLKDLVKIIKTRAIKSIAIPPLGCGNGKLKWDKVQGIMSKYLGELEGVDVQIFTPNKEIQEILAKENKPKKVKLTPAKTELLYMLFIFEASGQEASLFIANKLAYFLQRMGENQLKLRFTKHFYGPYSNQVDHLMYAMNGTFLSGLEQRTAKAFDPIKLNYPGYPQVKAFIEQALTSDQKNRLGVLITFIQGFESPLSMEALATVDFILQEFPQATAKKVLEKIQEWNPRKKRLLKMHQIEAAMHRLNQFQHHLGNA